MKANPDKFQAIAIGPKTNKHNLSFDLKGNKITCEGVYLQFVGIFYYRSRVNHS